MTDFFVFPSSTSWPMTFLSETLYKCHNLGPNSISFWVFTFFENLWKCSANFRIQNKILQKIKDNSFVALDELFVVLYNISFQTPVLMEYLSSEDSGFPNFSFFLKIYEKSNRSFEKVFDESFLMKNWREQFCCFLRALRRGL